MYLVLKEGHDETDTYPMVNQFCIDQSETGQSHIRKSKVLLAKVNTWAETTGNVSASALGFMRQLHTCIFSKFTHVYRHKNIWPVRPYRKLVKKAKQTLTVHSDNDHS